MYGLFIKVFFQNFLRQRLFALINVGGLAIGFACCLLIAAFVQYELDYDRHYANAPSIYLVDQVMPRPNPGVAVQHQSSGLLATQLQQEYSQQLVAARYVPALPSGDPVQLESETIEAQEAEVRFADAAFLQIFDFVWLEGSPQTALLSADEIVLTRELATKYFGNASALGRTLKVDAATEVRITGVVEKPNPTTLDFSALLTVEQHERIMRKRGLEPVHWYTLLYQTFVLIDGNSETVTATLAGFANRYIPENSDGQRASLQLLPLTGLHLGGGSPVISNEQRILACVAIAVIILLIAAVNFVNLSTSRASTRALEAGLRLALGSPRSQLARQFLAEAMLTTVLAMVLALVIAELVTPFVNNLFGLQLDLFRDFDRGLVLLLLLATLLTGLMAGLYPAFYLSAARPARVLRGDLTRGRAGIRLRSALVVLQFTLSITFIVCGLVMSGQLDFLHKLDLGFSPDRKILIALPDKQRFDMNAQWSSLRNQLLQVPGVNSVSYALDSPLMNVRFASAIARPGEPAVGIDLVPQASEYLQQYDIELLAGRYFEAESNADAVTLQDPAGTVAPKGAYILNESAARVLGFSPEEFIGRNLIIPMGRRGVMNATVVGVVKDTVPSAFTAARPTLYYVPDFIDFFFVNGTLTLDVNPAQLTSFNTGIADSWSSYFPDVPLRLRYLDDVVRNLYEAEQQQRRIVGYAALAVVLIACVGLLGLASFNAEQRRKEIGIRKVMGGTVWGIVLLLTNDFSRLVLFANVIAWPLAYAAMERWLQNFAYRIDLTPLVFIGSGLIALCIAWVTVGSTAAKAASQKPVLALRYE